MSYAASPFSPRRGQTSRITRGTVSQRSSGTWELLIAVNGRRKYVGSFASQAEGQAAQEHVYQERLAGRPIPDYRLTPEQFAAQASATGRKGRLAQLADVPPSPKRDPIVIPRDDKPIARCRCSLALPCESCIPTARDFAESRRSE